MKEPNLKLDLDVMSSCSPATVHVGNVLSGCGAPDQESAKKAVHEQLQASAGIYKPVVKTFFVGIF